MALAYDSGPDAGMGHLSRLQALGAALSRFGTTTDLVPAETPGVEADVVVVDSYRHRADDRERFRGRLVAAVDDLYRDLATDVVVDPSPGADAAAHRAAPCVLAGPSFALLDPALAGLVTRPVDGPVVVALVATGAADHAGTGAHMAMALVDLLPGVHVQLAIGKWAASEAPPGVAPIRSETGLGTALADADLVITAAGVTLLEALALGRPTIAVVLAENQRRAAQGAEAAGACGAATAADAPMLAAELATALPRRQELSAAARCLVDGRGAERVAETLLARLG